MSIAVMMDRIAETSPRAKARIAGAPYLLTILAGIFAQGFISERLVVSAGLGLLGAVANILWLLVFGVNEQRWKVQANAAAASIWR